MVAELRDSVGESDRQETAHICPDINIRSLLMMTNAFGTRELNWGQRAIGAIRGLGSLNYWLQSYAFTCDWGRIKWSWHGVALQQFRSIQLNIIYPAGSLIPEIQRALKDVSPVKDSTRCGNEPKLHYSKFVRQLVEFGRF